VSPAELEASRRKALLASGVLFALAGALFLLGLGGREWAFLLGALLAFFAQLLIRAFRVEAKKALVSPLAEALGFRYSPGRGFSREEALASGLFPPPDRYEAEDLVEGEVSGIPFSSSDIALYRKVRVKSGNVSTYQYQKFFGGTLYRFHLPFPVEGEVRFGPRGRGMGVVDKGVLLTGSIVIGGSFLVITLATFSEELSVRDVLPFYAFLAVFSFLFFVSTLGRKKGLERVVLESPEFERLFDVYGEDQVETRKLLTPRVQEALVRLREYLGKPVWGAVRGRDLWLAVEGGDRFPVPVLRPVGETFEAQKARYQEELLEASRVVEALRLEEEAKRKGVWWRKTFVEQNKPSLVPEKENDTFGGDERRQTGGAPDKGL
jgi:hypothetical protein